MSATSTTLRARMAQRRPKPKLPAPLVRPFRHPLRFTWNVARMLTHKTIWTFVGVMAAAGVYWLVTQTNQPIHDGWHNLVPNDTERHHYRAVLEGFFGGILGMQVAWNHYKAKNYRKPKGLQAFMANKLHIAMPNDDKPMSFKQLAATPFLLVVFGIPGFVIALWLIGLQLGHGLTDPETAVATLNAHAPKTVASVLQNSVRTFIEDWPVKLMGYGAAITGRFAAKGVIDDLQEWFASRRVASRKPYSKIHQWLLPPAYLARYNDLNMDMSVALKKYSAWTSRTIVSGTIAMGLLAVLGFLAINFNLPHVH